MSDLDDLFKVVSEGKKKYEETDPKGKLIKEAKDNAKLDLSSLFNQLSTLKEDLEKELVVEEAKLENIQEQPVLITRVSNPESNLQLTEVVTPEVKPASDIHSKNEIEKYLGNNASFQQPDPDLVSKNVDEIRNKIKFLEQAIGRIAATGPGSGEVNFRWLDDVNRSTMTESNNNWVLEYDASTKKVQFTNNVGPLNDVNTSTLEVTTQATLASASVTDLTQHRIVLAGTNGELRDDPNLTFDGQLLTVNGDLTVNGNVTYINTTTLDVTDKNITIAKGATTDTLADGAGISVDGANAHITYRKTGDAWELDKNIIPSSNYLKNLGSVDRQFNEAYTSNLNTKTIAFNTNGYQTPLVAGQTGWNAEEDCLETKQADGSTLQHGYEHYIQIHNSLNETLYNGEVVMFAGIDEENPDNPIPVAGRFVANSSSFPLYLIGVMTNDVLAGGHGRATVFGKIHDLNTTGSTVGETWVRGDLLWAHPSMPGKLTKVRPTAPNVSTSVAAILKVGATDGVIMVRPTIFPRLYFASFASDQHQTHTAINTPKTVTFNTNIITSGFETINGGGVVKALNAGLYNFKFSMQLVSSNSSAANVWIWIRHNGVDVPLSARKLSLSSNSVVLAPSWNYQVSMLINDTFELMWAVDSTNISLSAPAATGFAPATPSATLSVNQVNL